VLLATTKPRKQNKLAALLHKSVMKKEFRRVAKVVQNQVIFIVKISKFVLLIYVICVELVVGKFG